MTTPATDPGVSEQTRWHSAAVRVLPDAQVATLLDLARARAMDPSVFDDHPPVFFRAEASSSRRDAYYTVMMPSTLKNYAEDAATGVPFMDSHRRDGMHQIIGRSLAGEFLTKKGATPDRVLVDFFTQPTLIDTMREFVDRMRAGLAADVSVGFHGGQTRCSICGKEMLEWWRSDDPCVHIPGVDYPTSDKKGAKRVTAEGQIEGARLTEVSTVYKGATPAATLVGMKARGLADAGLLAPEAGLIVSERWGLTIPGASKVWALGQGDAPGAITTAVAAGLRATITPEEGTMEITQEQLDQAVDAARATTEEAWRARVGTALTTAGRTIGAQDDLSDHVRALGDEIRRLGPLADDGKRYRDDLIAQTLDEGVRAFDRDFDRESEEAELRSLPLDNIKRRLDRYAKIATERLGDGGRTTKDDAGKQPVAITSGGRRRGSTAIYRG